MKHFSFLIFSLALLALIQNSFAATIIVTTTTDEVTTNGKCSLREAIVNMNQGKDSYPDCANTSSGSYATNDTIQLEGKTYCLSLSGPISDTEFFGDLDIKKAVTISGQSQSSTLIDAGHRPKESGKKSTCAKALNDRVLHVHKNIADVVTLKNLTITGGLLKNGDQAVSSSRTFSRYIYYGAGIYAQSQLALDAVTVSHNEFDIPRAEAKKYYYGYGGGIYADALTTISRSIIAENSALHCGGGIYGNSMITISQSKILQNSAGYGGGIYSDVMLKISESQITHNSARAYYGSGGGIHALELILNKSTVSNNSAPYGGGISAGDPTIKISQSIIAEKAVTQTGGYAPTLLINNSTIAANSAENGGGIVSSSQTTIKLKNTILAGNTATMGERECYVLPIYFFISIGEGFVSHGYNFIAPDESSHSHCSFIPKANFNTDITDKSFVELKLGHLSDNGGSTQTHALLAGSPAIDTGSCIDMDGNVILTDQRGYLKPTQKCDIGAYEKDLATSTLDPKKVITPKSSGGCSLTTAVQQGLAQ